MKHIRIEICAEEYIISYISKIGKKKEKIYCPYSEWIYHHAPMCDNVEVIPLEEKEKFIQETVLEWKAQLKEHFSNRNKRFFISDIQIIYKIVKEEFCENFSVRKCLNIMTPEQFFLEFGKFTTDKAN